MNIILHTGLGEELLFLNKKYSQQFSFQQYVNGSKVEDAEIFLIGPYETDPVHLVQKINSTDRLISILILAFPADFPKTKQSLQFAPFVGKNSACISYSRQFNLQQALETAALRTRQRRSFSRINTMQATVNTLAAKPLKVQNLGVFLDRAPIGTLLVDQKDNIIDFNQKAKKIFSLDSDKSLILKDLFPGMSLQQLSWKAKRDEQQIIELNGHFLEVNVSEVENEEGEPLSILLINDITEQKKKETALQESEALFRLMAESLPQLVWKADEKGYRNFFNESWITYTGRQFSQLEGWQWTDVIHPDDLKLTLPAYQKALNTGEAFQYELRMLRHDGVYRWHLVRGVPRKTADDKVLMWIGTNTDIQEHKAFAEELEQKVKERTYELETSNSELEQFVYVTSHDLQEPLRKIRMFADLLRMNADELPPAASNQLEKINTTAQRMSTLLEELLNFTQLSKEERFEVTDLNLIIDHALDDLELVIQQKAAVVHVDKLPVIHAVPVQMHHLFYNLISNSLKFTKPDQPPVIEIRSLPVNLEAANKKHLHPDKKYVEILVKDNGIGFDPKQASQIFLIFQRLHNRNTYSGTGIGLALCKKVVTHHYGDIYACGEPGKGAAFHILLPE